MDRPYVIVNCAMSADGKIALPDRRQTPISSREDFKRVHRLRNECGAIVIGVGTVLNDDPKLTVKEEFVPRPRHPLRVVFDSHGRTPPDAEVLKHGVPTLICTTYGADRDAAAKLERNEKVDVLKFPPDRGGGVSIPHVLELLRKSGVEKVMVEGGSTIIAAFIASGCVDEYSVFVGSMIIGGEGSPTPVGGSGAARFEDVVGLELVECREMEGGALLRYKVGKG